MDIEVEEIAVKIILKRCSRITLHCWWWWFVPASNDSISEEEFCAIWMNLLTCLHLSLRPLFLVRVQSPITNSLIGSTLVKPLSIFKHLSRCFFIYLFIYLFIIIIFFFWDGDLQEVEWNSHQSDNLVYIHDRTIQVERIRWKSRMYSPARRQIWSESVWVRKPTKTNQLWRHDPE